MQVVNLGANLFTVLALAMFVGGCSTQTPNHQRPVEVSGPPQASGHEEHEGPHGGHVIELGRNHQYHAEVVENEEAGTVTVYMLDKEMRELAIDQPTIVMNLIVDGQAKSFELAAAGAIDGAASRFDAADKTLFEVLHEHEASGKLRATIDGAPYIGEVEHHHHAAGDKSEAPHGKP